MRAALAFLMLGALWNGEAAASSIVVLPAHDGSNSPSIVTLAPAGLPDIAMLPEPGQQPDPDVTAGAVDPAPQKPEPAGSDIIMLSPSIIALGTPAVEQEKVAAIGKDSAKPRPDPLPMVIRGGIVGDAFSSAATGEPVPLKTGPKEDGKQAGQTPPRQAGKPPAQTTETAPAEAPPPQPEIKME